MHCCYLTLSKVLDPEHSLKVDLIPALRELRANLAIVYKRAKEREGWY